MSFLMFIFITKYLQYGRPGLDSWVGKIPWRRKWKPTPVLLPGESHGGRSLVGYSPWGRKESDMTERLHFHFQTFIKRQLIFSVIYIRMILTGAAVGR